MIAAALPGRGRRLLVPATTTLLLLAVLISLGVWQVHRLAWKTALLAAIDHAEASPPIPLPAAPTQFEKVRVEGRFRPDRAALYGAQVRDLPQGPVLGGQLLVPLERDGASTVIVDRGWVPENAPPSTPSGTVSVDGYVRVAEHPGWFSPADDTVGRRFFTMDPVAIGHALGFDAVAPFTLIVLRDNSAGATDLPPFPAYHLPRPPNDHFGYAVTWFGLAGVLAVIFVTYSMKVLRHE